MADALKTNLSFLPLHFSRNRITHVAEPASNSITDRASLRYYLDVYLPKFAQSTDFDLLTTLEGRERIAPTIGTTAVYEGAYFQLQDLVDGALKLQKPKWKQNTVGVSTQQTTAYKVTERIQPPNTTLANNAVWAFKGGVSEEDFQLYGNDFFSSYLAQTRKFLTYQPSTQAVGAEQELFLYYLLNFSPLPTTLRVRTKVYYTDGTSETLTPLSIGRLSLYTVAIVPCGVVQLGLDQMAKTVKKYELWLSTEANERISEVRTYLIDTQYRAQERHLHYANSLGGFDPLRLVGTAAETLAVSRSVAKKEKPLYSFGEFPEMQIIKTIGEHTLVASTGYIERDGPTHRLVLSDLFLSKEIYLVTDKGHVPVILETAQHAFKVDDEDLISFTLTFRKSIAQENFSNLPAKDNYAGRPTVWVGVNMFYLLDGVGKRTGYGQFATLQLYYSDNGQPVRPFETKPNVPGDPDYIEPVLLDSITPGTTPYPSTAISRPTTFQRNNCQAGFSGSYPTITVAAGKYGGENPGDADALAEAEYASLNTQAFANANGTCTLFTTQNYSFTVPAGHFHYRSSDPSDTRLFYENTSGQRTMGVWTPYDGASNAYQFATNSNDRSFPITTSGTWKVGVKCPTNRTTGVRIYRNGNLMQTVQFTVFGGVQATYTAVINFSFAEYDRLYFEWYSNPN